MITSYHTAESVTKRPDGVLTINRFHGGHRVDGPEQAGDYVKTDDGKFYQIAQIITIVVPVEGDDND